jgi:hypothetical protein
MTTRACLVALLLVAGSVFAEPLGFGGRPFTLHVVDAATGRGLHKVKITTDDGIVCYPLRDGSASFSERSLMGRNVRFAVQGTVTTLPVTHGGTGTITVPAFSQPSSSPR